MVAYARERKGNIGRGGIIAQIPSPRQMLKKQMSSFTSGGSSSFSLVGSSLLDSQLVDAMEVDSGSSSSRALTKSKEVEKRGWDWRFGLDAEAKGEDILRILRMGLAKEIARHWMRGEEG